MANSPKKKPTPKRRGGCFFGCFGYPATYYDGDDISNKKLNPSLDGVVIINKVPKRMKLFSWSRKQRSATKTVPLDTTASPEKPRKSWSKDAKKGKNISQPLDNRVNSLLTPAPESTSPAQKTNRTTSKIDQGIILGNNKSSSKTTLDRIEEAMCQESPPPPNRTTATSIATGKALGHSSSLPLIYKGKKLATTNSGGDPPTIPKKKSKDTVVVGRVDSVVGMSIILVMLSIMLLWGKVCAILCTSAWLYFVPRFRIKSGPSKANKNEYSSSIEDQVDINTQEYKKKVVLEGLLDRKKHRKSSVSRSK